ncbi:MAG: hypothetical protein GXO78_01995 [Calditrichaeota bacterium]|nr:hypothetical protein [Calditrichota bacterium]
MRMIFLFLVFISLMPTALLAESWQMLRQRLDQLQILATPPVDKCGFPAVLAAFFSGQSEIRHRLQAFSSQVTLQTYRTFRSPSGHFEIYYQTEGIDAIPTYNLDGDTIPDYLEFVAGALDRAWAIQVDSLGFRPPPAADGSPRQVYPVYCQNLAGSRTYGMTLIDQEIPALPGENYTSHIIISTDFSFVRFPADGGDPIVRDSLAIAVTAAHEFTHALQLGYHIWNYGDGFNNAVLPDFWFIESSATYMEEVIADTVNDYYQYLPYYLQSLDISLFKIPASNLEWIRVYGEVLFPMMLGYVYGPEIVREVWENILDAEAVVALDRVLQERGSSLSQEWFRFASWLYFTGSRAQPDRFFPEASQYPEPDLIQTVALDSVQNDRDAFFQSTLPPLAYQFLSVLVQIPGTYFLTIQFAQKSEALGGVLFLPEHRIVENFEYVDYPFITEGEFQLAAVGGPWSFTMPDSQLAFELFGGWVPRDEPNAVRIYPAKWTPDHPGRGITFLNLPRDARIEIFTAAGIRIRTIHTMTPVYFWVPQTDSGSPLASGVYIFRVTAGNFQQLGKFLIVR